MATERQRMNHLPSSNKTNESSRCTESLTQRYDEHGVVAEYPQQQQHQLAAVRRVQRLMDFHREHPECSLVDSPMAVQTLMSRADIAVTLQACLLTVHTVSGVPVGSPAYAVIGKQQPQQQCEAAVVATAATASIEEQVANLSFPIIVKPLTAAGSKASHAMAVLLDRTALQQVVVKVPCLCQEYSNHDGFLYKVYVLGDYVSVHKRRSLPNLPKNQASTLGFVEFDSQRPYPRLSDFGFAEVYLVDEAPTIVAGTVGSSGECQSLRINDGAAAASTHSTAKPAVVITAEEVKPVVDALREAFGLDLFGFDILITNTHVGDDEGQRRKMLVVDVNYFPSYKEVPNFPELLAKYLTDRAFASRRKACAARSRRASAH